MMNYKESINTEFKKQFNNYLAQHVTYSHNNLEENHVVNLDHTDFNTTNAIKNARFKGYITNLQNIRDHYDIQQMKLYNLFKNKNCCIYNDDIIKDHAVCCDNWTHNEKVVLWNYDLVSFFPTVKKGFLNLSSNPYKFLCEDTLVAFTFIAVPDSFRLSRMNEEYRTFCESTPNLEQIMEFYFEKIESALQTLTDTCKSINRRKLESLDVSRIRGCHFRVQNDVCLIIYEDANCPKYKMATFYVRLSHSRDCHHISRSVDLKSISDNEEASTNESQFNISYNGNIFGRSPEECQIDIDLKLPIVPEYVSKLDYAPVVYYIAYRFATSDASIDNTSDTKIPYPMIDIPFDKIAHIILYKMMQGMKSPWAVAVIWHETFLYGNICCYGTRNIGCRSTGIPGFQTKGIRAINEKIRTFIEDKHDNVSTQIHNMYNNIEKVVSSLSLVCINDDQLRWGIEESGTKDQNIITREMFISVRNSGNTCIVYPANRRGLTLIKSAARMSNTKNIVILQDEHDEAISSYNKKRTITERAYYGSDDDMTEQEIEYETESEEESEEIDLIAMKSLSDMCIRSYYITATMSPIIWSYHNVPFYVVKMLPASNYIGYNTPDYCIDKVKHVHVDAHKPIKSKKRNADGKTVSNITETTWLNMESNVLDKIRDQWNETSTCANGALMVTQRTTGLILRQTIGARAILQHTISEQPLVVVLNNSKFTRLYLSLHFNAESYDKSILESCKRRLNQQGYKLETSENFFANCEKLIDQSSAPLGYMIDIPNTTWIYDNFGLCFKRRHPSTILEFVNHLFDHQKTSPRIIFLETLLMASREKSYVNFSRSFQIQSIYINFDGSDTRNIGQLTQCFGRVAGVCTSDNTNRHRFAYVPLQLWTKFIEYMKRQDLYIEVFRKFSGLSISEIEDEINLKEDCDWDNLVSHMFNVRLAETKKHHQEEIDEKSSRLILSVKTKIAPNSETVPDSTQLESIVSVLRILAKFSTVEEIYSYLQENDLFFDLSTNKTYNGKDSELNKTYFVTKEVLTEHSIKQTLRHREKRSKQLEYKGSTIGLSEWSADIKKATQDERHKKALMLLLNREDMLNKMHSSREIWNKMEELHLVFIDNDRPVEDDWKYYITTYGTGNFPSRINTELKRLCSNTSVSFERTDVDRFGIVVL